MTTQEIIYLSFGLVIAFLYGQYKRYKSKYNSTNELYNQIKKRENDLNRKEFELNKTIQLQKEKNKRRRARYVSKGWTNTLESNEYKQKLKEYNDKLKNDPNYDGVAPKKPYKWDIIYIIEEQEKSENSSKFKAISVSSTNYRETLTDNSRKRYLNKFEQASNGGWIRHDDDDFKWLVDKTQKEKRNDLINNILEE